MHSSTRILSAFVPLALYSLGGCAVPATDAPPTQTTAQPAANARQSAQPSARAALERVLEVVATPAAASAGWEPSRIEARGVEAGVRVWMDVEVRGADEQETNALAERLLESLRGLEGASEVEVRGSYAREATWVRLSGVSLVFEAPAPRAGVAAEDGRDLMSSIRGLSTEPEIRLGGVDIERRGDDDTALEVSAHAPAGGQRLDNLRRFLSELETRHGRVRIVRVSLKSAWKAGVEPAPDPLRFHWLIEVESGI
jgi:hypothetical protein